MTTYLPPRPPCTIAKRLRLSSESLLYSAAGFHPHQGPDNLNGTRLHTHTHRFTIACMLPRIFRRPSPASWFLFCNLTFLRVW